MNEKDIVLRPMMKISDMVPYLKIRILNTIEEIPDEDGYKIVNLYLECDFNDKERPKRVHESIRKKVSNEYYQKYFLSMI